MAVHTYECLFLLDPNKASANWDGVQAEVNGVIEQHGGELVDSRPWGEPKLCYPIKKFRKGSYLLTYFKAESTKVPLMEKEYKLHDVVLRQMLVKLEPQIAEPILAHLSGEMVDAPVGEGEFAEA